MQTKERVMVDLTKQYGIYASTRKDTTPEIFRGYARKWVEDKLRKAPQ